jgi:hypothetical protein
MSTVHVRPGQGRHYPMIDGDHTAKVAVRDAGGAVEVFEVIAPAAPMAPPHVSPWTAVLFLLEGRITAPVDGTSDDVQPISTRAVRGTRTLGHRLVLALGVVGGLGLTRLRA